MEIKSAFLSILTNRLTFFCFSPSEQQVNYAFYDPELHWCKACNVFPKTAKDYLNHLHSKEHADVVKSESPWHENNQNVVIIIVVRLLR